MTAKKFDLIFFIDDDEATNFYHKIVLEEAGVCENVQFFEKANNALEHLQDASNIVPQVIFLDINMPRIDGWIFLDKYKDIEFSNPPKIIMFSTSISPSEKEKAEEHPLIYKYVKKPLTNEIMHQLADEIL